MYFRELVIPQYQKLAKKVEIYSRLFTTPHPPPCTSLLLHHVWHIHNELTDNKPAPPAKKSRRFLCSYVDSLLFVKQFLLKVVSYSGRALKEKTQADRWKKVRLKWTASAPGCVKLNVDGSFIHETGAAGAGMVFRDHNGDIIFTACRVLWSCSSPLEAELVACS